MSLLGLFALVLILLYFRQSLILILFGVAGYVHLVYGAGTLEFFIQDIWAALDAPVILSVPLFVLVGVIMSQGSIAKRLIALMVEVSKPLPGGLGVATILSCAVFAAISGSAIVTMLGVGAIMYKALTDNGYSQSFAIGAICTGGILGVIIPPSIPLILYGMVTESSVSDLFLAGIGPGILITVVLSVYAIVVNRRFKREKLDLVALWAALKDGVWALFLPVILLGGIYSGHFSPTESAAVGIAYAGIVEILVYRDLRLFDFGRLSVEAGTLVGSLFPLIAATMSLNILATEHQIPHMLVAWVTENLQSSTAFMLSANALLLVAGSIMDTASALLISAPLLHPLADVMNVNSIHFGIIMILNLGIGFITPPFGLNLIVAMTAFNKSFATVCRATAPFVVIMLLCLLLVIFLPVISIGFLG